MIKNPMESLKPQIIPLCMKSKDLFENNIIIFADFNFMVEQRLKLI